MKRPWPSIISGLILTLLLGALVWVHIDERASRHRSAWDGRLEDRFEQNIPSGGGK